MICQECRNSGEKSTVTQGISLTTLMYFPIIFDEQGNRIETGRNSTKTEYSCSNGHRWYVNA